MKKMLIAALMAGLIGGTTMAADDAFARGGKGGGSKGQGICPQTTSSEQTAVRQRLRDGSCLNAERSAAKTQAKKGNTYGPGDSTGNKGVQPKDGSGSGAAKTK